MSLDKILVPSQLLNPIYVTIRESHSNHVGPRGAASLSRVFKSMIIPPMQGRHDAPSGKVSHAVLLKQFPRCARRAKPRPLKLIAVHAVRPSRCHPSCVHGGMDEVMTYKWWHPK